MVVGGGITGLTTALRLVREGVQVIVVEAARVGSGVTGNNTAKVSALQSTMLSAIASRHGPEAAQDYAAASAAAVEDVAALTAEEGIECELERRTAATYAAEESQRAAVWEEFEAASAAGLPVRWEDDDAGLPFAVHGAVLLDGQLAFHPVKYAQGLARAVIRNGGEIFENSRVLSVAEGRPCRSAPVAPW